MCPFCPFHLFPQPLIFPWFSLAHAIDTSLFPVLHSTIDFGKSSHLHCMGIKQTTSRQAVIVSNHLHLYIEIYTSVWIVQWFKVKRVFLWSLLLPRKSLYSNISEHSSMNYRKVLSLGKLEVSTVIFFQFKSFVQQINEWAFRKKKKVKISCFFQAYSFNIR